MPPRLSQAQRLAVTIADAFALVRTLLARGDSKGPDRWLELAALVRTLDKALTASGGDDGGAGGGGRAQLGALVPILAQLALHLDKLLACSHLREKPFTRSLRRDHARALVGLLQDHARRGDDLRSWDSWTVLATHDLAPNLLAPHPLDPALHTLLLAPSSAAPPTTLELALSLAPPSPPPPRHLANDDDDDDDDDDEGDLDCNPMANDPRPLFPDRALTRRLTLYARFELPSSSEQARLLAWTRSHLGKIELLRLVSPSSSYSSPPSGGGGGGSSAEKKDRRAARVQARLTTATVSEGTCRRRPPALKPPRAFFRSNSLGSSSSCSSSSSSGSEVSLSPPSSPVRLRMLHSRPPSRPPPLPSSILDATRYLTHILQALIPSLPALSKVELPSGGVLSRESFPFPPHAPHPRDKDVVPPLLVFAWRAALRGGGGGDATAVMAVGEAEATVGEEVMMRLLGMG